MKKLLFIATLCVATLISCSIEKEEIPEVEEFADVTFTLNAENVMNTRAISDGKGANQLMYGVFNEAGELIISKATKNDVGGLTAGGYTMKISLAKGHTYQVAFWAQNSECEAYEVSDDMKVSINYEGINNDETRDAFFAVTEKFNVDRSSTISVILKRPFAQVNVGAFPFDWENATDMGVDISQSGATISGIANELNLLDGSVSGEVKVDYSFNALPNEDLKVDVDENNVDEIYKYLSMSYILADVASSTHTMSFTFADKDGGNIITFDNGLGAVPIQRNWRTNIVGQILTGDITFNIKIDPIYEGETINSAGLYYNFSEDTTVKDKVFAFNTYEWATFTTENNNLLTLDNVTFSGKVGQIAIGEYRGKQPEDVPYTNILKNVKAENMKVMSQLKNDGNYDVVIENVQGIDCMALLLYLRGNLTISDCVFTGTTSDIKTYTDYYGDVREVITYDCGFPNFSVATIDNCTIGKMYAWSHSQITITNSKVDYIRCSTHNQNYDSFLVIDEGTEVEEIFVSSSGQAKSQKGEDNKKHWVDLESNQWAPSLIIKAGAKVKKLDMNGRGRYNTVSAGSTTWESQPDVIIEEGAIVEEIVNEETVNVPPTPEP